MVFFYVWCNPQGVYSVYNTKNTDMKKITLPWNRTLSYVGNTTNKGISRMCLCYGIDNKGRINKKKPVTIIDHIVRSGQNVEKEGFEINIVGNPLDLDYDSDILFIPTKS